MTHNSCIYAKQRDGEQVPLFEGGNPLPFFWLMLLDSKDVEEDKQRIKHAAKEGVGSGEIILVLDKLQAITRATSRRGYIALFFETSLRLFDDWIYFLQISDFSDMKIYLDLSYVASFYHNSDLFFDSLIRAVNSFDEKKETWFEVSIAGICGHEARNKNKRRFVDFSDAYNKKHQKDVYGRFEKPLRLHKHRSFRRMGTKRKVYALLIVIAAITILLALLIG